MADLRIIAEPPRLLTRKEAAARFGVSETTFDGYVDKEIAPKPIVLSDRTHRWHSGQISEQIDKLAGIGAGSSDEYWDT